MKPRPLIYLDQKLSRLKPFIKEMTRELVKELNEKFRQARIKPRGARFLGTIYSRMMALVLSSVVIALSILSVMLYQSFIDNKIESRLDELMIQAEEIAFLANQRSSLSRSLDSYLKIKVIEVQTEFDAGIIVMDVYGRNITQGVETNGDIAGLPYDVTIELLREVVESGTELRMRTPAKGVAGDVFTVAVPWSENDMIMGVVFIHTSAQTIRASYAPILVRVVIAMGVSILVASVLLFVVVRQLTLPLTKMAKVATRIAKGEFNVNFNTGRHELREIADLSTSLAEMADDLKRLETMRRSFVSDVSHELRSPLTSITGFLQGIKDEVIPIEEQQKYIEIVLDETRRLSRLVGTLLDLSRIESDSFKLEPTRFDLRELIMKALFRFEDRVAKAHMEVVVEIGDDPTYVIADKERIDQVLTNLIDNAIKYGRSGGFIWVTLKAAGTVVMTSVRDDGIGIPEAELPLIFERFHTVDKARTSGKGTGLGLAIVKKILELHGQEIWVESSSKGSNFTFTLNLAGKLQ